MKLTVDRDADALYLVLDEAAVVDSEEVAPGIVLDYNADNAVVGIEMLHLSKRAPGLDPARLTYEMLPAPANPQPA